MQLAWQLADVRLCSVDMCGCQSLFLLHQDGFPVSWTEMPVLANQTFC